MENMLNEKLCIADRLADNSSDKFVCKVILQYNLWLLLKYCKEIIREKHAVVLRDILEMYGSYFAAATKVFKVLRQFP